MTIDRETIQKYFEQLQSDICHNISSADGAGHFNADRWTHKEGGGGISRILTKGNVLEKAGVNFSAVHGKAPEKMRAALQLNGDHFFATGVSIVMHPTNPFVPIIHMNVRYFEMSDGTWWFGGGIDLTPIYVISEDAYHFHKTLKDTCDLHDKDYYVKFKKWADDYFYIPHRNETRGIGGIFFDRLHDQNNKSSLFSFVKSVGETFAPLYAEIIRRRRNTPFNDSHLKWQQLRRGRYVEFNLVYDKGTKFGLETGGRTESILMSMPPVAGWEYGFKPSFSESDEQKTLDFLVKGYNWV